MVGPVAKSTLLGSMPFLVTVLSLHAATVHLGDPHLRAVPRTEA